MSVLICSLCEKNRDAITSAIQNVLQTLGTKAAGLSPFLHHLVCKSCQQSKKDFEYRCVIGSHDLKYQISSNEKGEFNILLLNTNPPLDINLLTIMNAIKLTLEENNSGFANDQSCWLWIKNASTQVFCACGSPNFKPESLQTLCQD